jgi:hypothetical protein
VPFPKPGVDKLSRGGQNGAEPRHHTSSFSASCEAVPFQFVVDHSFMGVPETGQAPSLRDIFPQPLKPCPFKADSNRITTHLPGSLPYAANLRIVAE